MNRKVLWKRIAALGVTAAMLMTSVSTGFADEITVVPEVLAGEGVFSEEKAEAYSADLNIVEDDKAVGESAVTYSEELPDSLIEDSDILQASDDPEEMITITFDGGEGSNYERYDEDKEEYVYDGGSIYTDEILSGEGIYIPWEEFFRADGKRMIGWFDAEGNPYYYGEYYEFTESTTLTAEWESEITITFDGGEGSNYQRYDEYTGEYSYDGGSIYEVKTFPGEEVNIPCETFFQAEGKRQTGWFDAEGTPYDFDGYYEFNESTTLTAEWESEITITFDGGDGSNHERMDENGDFYYDGGSIYEVNAFPGEEVGIPWEGFFRAEGKILTGWTDAEGNSYDFNEYYEFYENTTLTALWDEGITITFEGGEGSNYCGEYDDENNCYPYDGGPTYEMQVAPDEYEFYVPGSYLFKAEGKRLTGWIDAEGNSYYLGEYYPVTESITLTAVWEESVTFTLYPTEGHWEDEEDGVPIEAPVSKGALICWDEFDTPEHETKIFVGWADEDGNMILSREEDDDGDYNTITAEEDMDLYAVWQDAVVITLDPTEGYWLDDNNEPNQEDKKCKFVPGEKIDFRDLDDIPDYADKAFAGWEDKDGNLVFTANGRDDAGNRITITVDEDMTLYAVWVDAYKLTLKVNGGYWWKDEDGTDKEDRTYIVGQGSAADFDYMDEPNHDTKAFSGWATDSAGKNIVLSQSKRTYTPTKNMTLYAVWTNPVIVTYVGNGGKTYWYNEAINDDVYVDRYTEKYAKGSTVQLDDELFEREGYRLTGWKVGNTVYNKSWYSFTVNANTTVTAQWTKEVTVRWHLNGGELKWDDSGDDVFVEYYAQGDELSSFQPEKAEYAFTGWSRTEGSDELYIDRYNSKNLKAQSDMDLYAVWAEAYTVTFNGNGGLHSSDEGEVPSVDQTIPKGESISIYGYPGFYYPYSAGDELKAFSHWALDENDENPVGWNDPVTEDMEVYAIWGPGVRVIFDLNGGNQGGSLSFSDVVEKDIYIGDHFYYGSYITPPAGKTFGGWSLKRNDKSTKITAYQLTQDVTLFALWDSASKPAPKPTDKITITKAPSGVKAKAAKKGKVTLTWKKFKQTKKTKAIWKKVKSVEVQYSTDKNFKTGVVTKKLGKKKTKLVVKKLKAKTTYYFRVRYVEGPYKVSKWSAVKKVKAKK